MPEVINLKKPEDVLDRIRRYIESPPENSRVATISPVIAEVILKEFNHQNRPKKPVKIAEYAAAMAAGQWALTGDTIKFSNAHRLRDGQNRLMACIRANAPFTTHIVFGIDDMAFDVLDRGRNRTNSDVLSIAGFTNSAHLSTAVRWAFMLEKGLVKKRLGLDPKETLHHLQERYADLPAFLPKAIQIYRMTGMPIGMTAAYLYLFDRIDSNAGWKFGEAWASGHHSGKFAAIGKLQKKVAEIAAASSGRVHDTVRAALVVQAWNLVCAGKAGRLSDFRWTPTDEFPEIQGLAK